MKKLKISIVCSSEVEKHLQPAICHRDRRSGPRVVTVEALGGVEHEESTGLLRTPFVALVEALAVESFEALATALHGAAMTASGTAIEKLQAIGVAYVCFSLEHAGAFHFIFRPELHASSLSQVHEGSLGSSPIDQASHHAYQVLIDAIVACQQEGWISPGDPAPLALTAWCTVHGLATLLLHGSLKRRMQEMQAVEDAGQLAEIVTQTLTRGLLARERTSETMIP